VVGAGVAASVNTSAVAWRWGEVDASDDGGRLCLTHRQADARLWVDGGRLVRGAGYVAADAAVRRDLARVGAIVRLRQRGRYLVHAAGAVDPEGRAWLLAGDSGSGKSTLAYALARSGWHVLGDDGVLVEQTGAGLIAHPWREPLRVSARLTPSFPELAAERGEPHPEDARQRIPLTMRSARSAPLVALVLVERSTAFSITTTGPVSALASLVRQSPWVVLGDEWARPHLDVLRQVAAQPVFRLRHTPAELHSLPDVLLGVLS
jgi:hypothetical protein